MARQDLSHSPAVPPADPSTPASDSSIRWQQEYENLIQRMGLTSEPPPAPGADRRQHPRVTLPPGSPIYVHGNPQRYEIHDLSAGGLSLFAHHEIKPGTRLILSAMGLLALECDVVGCEIVETDPGLMEYRYRVRCKFADQVNGFQAFVLAQELFQQQ